MNYSLMEMLIARKERHLYRLCSLSWVSYSRWIHLTKGIRFLEFKFCIFAVYCIIAGIPGLWLHTILPSIKDQTKRKLQLHNECNEAVFQIVRTGSKRHWLYLSICHICRNHHPVVALGHTGHHQFNGGRRSFFLALFIDWNYFRALPSMVF
jgi:hypothetical protein